MTLNNIKRLFFALEVDAPWPEKLPEARTIDKTDRHMTVAFLGETDYEMMSSLLPSIPSLPFRVGMSAHFDRCLFLPERHPHVVAWRVNLWEGSVAIEKYQEQLFAWLRSHNLPVDTRNRFLPHVTLCRSPFMVGEWKQDFIPIPLIIKNLHLYESLGNVKYKPCWTQPLIVPFEEIEHTADIAFRVSGETSLQLYRNAFAALSFKFPKLLEFFSNPNAIGDVDEIVMRLNEAICLADATHGCPFKAVSFHGEIIRAEDQTLKWEMIVDV